MTDYGELLRLCGCGITALVCVSTLRVCDRSGVANGVALAMSILLAAAAVGAVLPVVSLLREKTAPYLEVQYADILWRAMAIGMTAELTADVIRSAGEPALADRLEFAARAVLLCIGLPLYDAIFSLAATLIGIG